MGSCENAGSHLGTLLRGRTNMAFKETLAAAREQRGMTQQDLAEKLYVTRQAVSRWENGETEPVSYTHLDVYKRQLPGSNETVIPSRTGTPLSYPA